MFSLTIDHKINKIILDFDGKISIIRRSEAVTLRAELYRLIGELKK